MAIRFLLVAALASMTASGQSNGSIQGNVVGDDGKPISGARVYAAIKNTSQAIKAPPIVANQFGNAVNAAADGSFSIPNLPAGLYVLCAQTVISGWLDPCHWSATPPMVVMAAGQSITGQKIVMAKGAVIQIRINDPSKLLSLTSSAIASDVEVLALASNKGYYHARIASKDNNGRMHELTLPFDLAHTLIVRSKQFELSDSKGAAISAAGHNESVNVANGKAAQQINFNVTGKAKAH